MTGTDDMSLMTRKNVLAMLKITPSHLSKIVNGKVKGLARLTTVQLGRRQLFRQETVLNRIAKVEISPCTGAY